MLHAISCKDCLQQSPTDSQVSACTHIHDCHCTALAGYVYLLVEDKAVSFEADESLEAQPDKLQLVYKWLRMAHSTLAQPNLQNPPSLDMEAADAATLAVLALLRAAGLGDKLLHCRQTQSQSTI